MVANAALNTPTAHRVICRKGGRAHESQPVKSHGSRTPSVRDAGTWGGIENSEMAEDATMHTCVRMTLSSS